ncbi:OmpP1/FadL family transporter [Laribacter hongkongensis]|uniref:OmpP1/FadL family transporter n=1 Tax=Laribacter hongkongensis TaxID=168471 RepID=UPI001EFD3F66|nr:OmpP1/FadL family transporter [Laribacter hongkongensis]MCG9125260.1 OmpP1/FadL family transporter [Laribacter hongkongensis]
MKIKNLSLAIALMGGIPGVALASGYHFGSQSVSAQGTAFASAAEADDASTIFYNPAGMSRLKGNHFSGGLTVVIPNSDYTDKGSVNFLKSPTGGDNGGTFAPSAVVAPSMYLTHQINDQFTAGIGMFVPFGASLDYGSGWAGRYGITKIDLMTININPSISFKLNEHHSFGFGISAQYMNAELDKASDAISGLIMAGTPSINPKATDAQKQVAGLARAGLISGDGSIKIKGTDWGYGFNLGYMFTLDENTRFGIAYRSAISQKLRGYADWSFDGMSFTGPDAAAAKPGVLATLNKKHPDSDASVDVKTPESLSVNGFHQINDKWAVMADVTWTRHSQMQNIDVNFNTPSEGDFVVRQNWRNTYKVSVGANYKYNDALMLRGGIAYDQSPVSDESLRHPALPDSNRWLFSLGGNYKFTKLDSLDFAYTYIDFANANLNYKDSCNPLGMNASGLCTGNGENTKGQYKTNIHMLGVQYNRAF